MRKGHCLCEKIVFEVEEVPGLAFNCHCSRCQRAHGSAFSTQVIVDPKSLVFVKGKTLLKEYVSATVVRGFCSHCGSRLINYDLQKMTYMSVSLSSLDNNKHIKPIGECFVPDKFDFIQLDGSIPHYKALPKL
jgi:hypothetical protein